MITRRHYAVESTDGAYRIDFDRENYVISVLDMGDIDASFSAFTGTQQNGRTITSRHLGTREVEIEGCIISTTVEEMRQMKAKLQRIVLPLRDFRFIVDDTYSIVLTADTTIQYSSKWYEHNNMLTTFTIEATANNPFFSTYGEQQASLSEWSKEFHFPHYNPVGQTFIFGKRLLSQSATVRNICEVPVGMKIRIKAVRGVIQNPQITNIETGEYFKLTTRLQKDEEVEISTYYGDKYVRNVTTGKNLLPYLDFTSTWLQLEPGYTTFRYDYVKPQPLQLAGEMECDITYTPQLIEV